MSLPLLPLTSSDAPAMAALHAAGFDQGWPETDMINHIERDIVWGVGAPLAGFLIIRPAEDQAELLTITIDSHQRGAGLGKSLLMAGEKAASEQGAEILFLEVAEDNGAAIALYRAAGYEPFGRRPAYYRRAQGRVAALTFRKRLDGSKANR